MTPQHILLCFCGERGPDVTIHYRLPRIGRWRHRWGEHEEVRVIAASATILDCPPERAWQDVQTSRLLTYITSPLVRFVPVDPPALPAVWSEERYLVQMQLFGLLPFGTQWIISTKPVIDATPGRQRYELRDNGHGDIIATWDHWIILRETDDGRTFYTDRVEVKAGLLTPFIWAYASLFYRYRQHRWRRLVGSGFAYED